MDLFGIKRRRAEREARHQREQQEMLDKRKALKASRKAIIDPWLQEYENHRMELGRKAMDREQECLKKENTTCPVCGSTNRIHKFQRLQGSLDGKLKGGSHGSYSGGLFGGYGYSNGSVYGEVHGEMDTLEINECKDCSNQWPIKKPSHSWAGDYVRNPFDLGYKGELGYFYRRLRDIIDKNEWPGTNGVPWVLKDFQETPREVLEAKLYDWYIGYDGELRWDDDQDNFDILHTHVCGYKSKPEFNNDKYLFQFTDEDWELAKKLLQRDEYANFVYPKSEED